MKKRIVMTEKAPAPIGPYSQAVVLADQNLIFTAGQIPVNPKTGEIVANDIQAQTQQVLENMKAILEEAGSGLDRVVKTTVFIKNMNDFSAINEVYARYFPVNPPARSVVEVARLPKGVSVEIECVAHTGVD